MSMGKRDEKMEDGLDWGEKQITWIEGENPSLVREEEQWRWNWYAEYAKHKNMIFSVIFIDACHSTQPHTISVTEISKNLVKKESKKLPQQSSRLW
jgi:hypothetical protein